MEAKMNYTVDLYKKAVLSLDSSVEYYLRNQITGSGGWRYGGILSESDGIVLYGSGTAVHVVIMAYFCPDCRFYRSETAYLSACRMFSFLYTNMRPSGLIDLHLANYDSGPDTSFSVIGMCDTYKHIKDLETDAHGEELKSRLFDAIRVMSEGIFKAGFHTPNHRWVECAALSMAMNITGRTEFSARINAFLSEGIDCDDEGEYTERSAGGYNHINNMALFHIAEELNRPDLLEPIRRNLLMMRAYFHTDFTIFTHNSTRQDKGKTVYADKYLYQYLRAGYLLGDKELLSVGRAILDSCIAGGRPVQLSATQLLYESETTAVPDVEPFNPGEYDRYFRNSGIIKIRHLGCTVSVIENQDIFFYLDFGAVRLSIKGGINFFNERHLRMSGIEKTETGYRMKYHGEGTYYLPLGKENTVPGVFDKERSGRGTTGIIPADVVMDISKTERGFSIKVKADGCTKVPVRFEMAVNSNAVIFGDGYIVRANAGGRLVPSRGYVKVDLGNSGIKIGPAFAETFITDGLFYSNPVDESKYNIFFNALIPFEHEFTIEPITRLED